MKLEGIGSFLAFKYNRHLSKMLTSSLPKSPRPYSGVLRSGSHPEKPEIAMLRPISAPLRLTSGNSLVLYRNILPERYSITLPSIEVVAEKKFAFNHDEDGSGNDVLCYDHRWHAKREVYKGLLINAYF